MKFIYETHFFAYFYFKSLIDFQQIKYHGTISIIFDHKKAYSLHRHLFFNLFNFSMMTFQVWDFI